MTGDGECFVIGTHSSSPVIRWTPNVCGDNDFTAASYTSPCCSRDILASKADQSSHRPSRCSGNHAGCSGHGRIADAESRFASRPANRSKTVTQRFFGWKTPFGGVFCRPLGRSASKPWAVPPARESIPNFLSAAMEARCGAVLDQLHRVSSSGWLVRFPSVGVPWR